MALQVKWHVLEQAFEGMKKNLDEKSKKYEQKLTNKNHQEETKRELIELRKEMKEKTKLPQILIINYKM